jgi:Bacterial PH domain
MHTIDCASTTRHKYLLARGRKIGQSVYAGVFFVGAGFFLKLAVDPIGRDFVLAIGGLSLILGLVIVLQAWTSRLILDGDRIEVRSAFRTRSATRAEIEGLRRIENQYGRWTRVYLKQDAGSFSVSDFFTGNDDLKQWFNGLPDLDGRDADEITKEVSLQEPSAQQENSISNQFGLAKAWAIGLSVLAGAVGIPVIWVSYAPVYKASLVLLLFFPIAGILLLRRYPLLFTVFKRKPDPRADLSFLLIWPGIGVAFSYQNSNDPTHLVNSFQLTYWVLAVLVSFLAFLYPSVWRSPSRWPVLFFLIITGGMYSMGLVNSVNTLLDHSVAVPYETSVLKKTESHQSKGTRYFLHVAPWGPISYSDEVDVPMHTYNETRVGDPVCYGLHPGFLHGPWYTSISCTEQPTPLAR